MDVNSLPSYLKDKTHWSVEILSASAMIVSLKAAGCGWEKKDKAEDNKAKKDGYRVKKTHMNNEFISSKNPPKNEVNDHRSTTIAEGIIVLQALPAIRSNKKLLLEATTLFEKSEKHDTFIALSPELKADYILYQLTGEFEEG